MELFTAIKERRSCRDFLNDPVDDRIIAKILEAGCWAPSPLNGQPWEFIVIKSDVIKEEIYFEAERCKKWAMEKSGWKWMGSYQVDFLKSVPIMIAVIGDSRKSGVDYFQKGGPVAFQHACAASVQNMLLAIHAMELGGLWFTLYDKKNMGKILNVDEMKVALALVCIGKPAAKPPATARKNIAKKVSYID